MRDMKNRIAVITGGTQGIGASIAKHLAANGMTVVVTYAHDKSHADKTVELIEDKGGHALAMKADVGSTEEVQSLFSEVNGNFGGLDILVNCAGIAYFKPTTIVETTDDFFDDMFNVNVKGTLRCLREAIKYLRTDGRIINFSTSGIAAAYPGFGAYNASKAAIEIFSRTLSKN